MNRSVKFKQLQFLFWLFFFNSAKDKCSGTDVTRNGGCRTLKYRYKN